MTIEAFRDTGAELDKDDASLRSIILKAIYEGNYDIGYQMTIGDEIIKRQTQLSIQAMFRKLEEEGYIQGDGQSGLYLADKGFEELAKQ